MKSMTIDLRNPPMPQVVLVLNGIIDFEVLKRYVLNGSTVISTDGAAAQLFSQEIIPSLVIGDMDSLPKHIVGVLSQMTTILTIEDQDTTDFEKALLHCKSLGFKDIVVFGFHGGDFDHSFNNVSVVAKFAKDVRFQIIDNGRMCFHIDSPTTFYNVNVGEIVSLITYDEVKLTTSGLFWGLTEEYLRFGEREGARNKATDSEVHLDIHTGSLIACFDYKF